MTDHLRAIVLGIVQGATEFLPVSSSGHLVIVPWLLGWTRHSLLFDTVLHWGTLLSIVLVFWRDFVDHFVGHAAQHWAAFAGGPERAPGLVLSWSARSRRR